VSSRYGGIYERGSREYTLDDFYALQLDKMEAYQCLKKSDVVIPEGEIESSSDEDGEDEDDSDESSDDEDLDTLVDEEETRMIAEKDDEVIKLEKVIEDISEDLEEVSIIEEVA